MVKCINGYRTMIWIYITVIFLSNLISVSLSTYTFLNSEQEERLKNLEYTFIEPAAVNDEGIFKSHHLHNSYTKQRLKREAASSNEINYRLSINNEQLQVILSPNHRLYLDNLVIEKRTTNSSNDKESERYLDSVLEECYYKGHIKGDPTSRVAISTCNGLTGLIISKHRHYFIEPLKGHKIHTSKPHPHLLYKATHLQQAPAQTILSNQTSYCDSQNQGVDEVDNRAVHRRHKRSYSQKYFVETLVVVDSSMVEYYKDEDINTYLFTIMNMVSVLFHDASIGNSIDINVVKLLLLGKDQENIEGLEITHHADKTLASFCRWQKKLNPPEPDPFHHDVAVLITRLDICSRMNEPCSTLGLAQVSGMCQPGRSCNVNEDTGLALAYTITHEIGHNFGMEHDGFNECNVASGEKSFIMFPEFLIDAGKPLVWSDCSRKSITRFLDRDWGYCLLDEPKGHYKYPYPDKPPGLLYDVNHQCRLQYGTGAEHCDGIESMCTTLWCRVNNHCVTRLEPAAEGTICAWDNNTETGVAIPQKWCYNGKCSAITSGPEAIHGGWAEWTDWTECSRTCGGGVSISERDCTNPMPANGGNYCIGERKKYRICQTDPCPADQPTFLEVQCASYNTETYKGELYDWEPVITNNPCQLNCKPKNMHFSVMLNDMVKDGTPCLPGAKNMCITGRCRMVGCDWKLESNATEDRCGICHGDGTTCTTVKDQYKGQQSLEGQGYVEATVIPEGARNIRIEEMAEANNYLAVKSETGEYYLNGYWYIQWTGNYNMAGTTVHYERLGNKEGITAPGPIKEPLHIMLLFQSHNPGVDIEYTVPNMNDSDSSKRKLEFSWGFLDWSHCTVSCGGGYQRKKAVCMEKEAGLVEDIYCYNMTKPDDQAKPCNEHLCPARWWMGPWQHCSVSCGEGGVRQRTVLCVRSLGFEEQMALDEDDCDSVPKPSTTDQCETRPAPCSSEWKTGPWTECIDACDTKTRNVFCTTSNQAMCSNITRPLSVERCSYHIKCGRWKTGIWSTCSKSCGGGVKHRDVTCVAGDQCKSSNRPIDFKPCNEFPCSKLSNGYQPPKSSHNRYELYREAKQDDKVEQQNSKNIWKQLWNFMVGENDETKKSKSTEAQDNQVEQHYNESWHTEQWASCSVSCGVGQKHRHVWCPLANHCDPEIKPHRVETCAGQPCITWVSGRWNKCSVSCGSGVQHREVQCISLETGEPVGGCDVNAKPSTVQECQLERCNAMSAGYKKWTDEECETDKLDSKTCKQLKGRGFCSFKYVSRNCCQLCNSEKP